MPCRLWGHGALDAASPAACAQKRQPTCSPPGFAPHASSIQPLGSLRPILTWITHHPGHHHVRCSHTSSRSPRLPVPLRQHRRPPLVQRQTPRHPQRRRLPRPLLKGLVKGVMKTHLKTIKFKLAKGRPPGCTFSSSSLASSAADSSFVDAELQMPLSPSPTAVDAATSHVDHTFTASGNLLQLPSRKSKTQRTSKNPLHMGPRHPQGAKVVLKSAIYAISPLQLRHRPRKSSTTSSTIKASAHPSSPRSTSATDPARHPPRYCHSPTRPFTDFPRSRIFRNVTRKYFAHTPPHSSIPSDTSPSSTPAATTIKN